MITFVQHKVISVVRPNGLLNGRQRPPRFHHRALRHGRDARVANGSDFWSSVDALIKLAVDIYRDETVLDPCDNRRKSAQDYWDAAAVKLFQARSDFSSKEAAREQAKVWMFIASKLRPNVLTYYGRVLTTEMCLRMALQFAPHSHEVWQRIKDQKMEFEFEGRRYTAESLEQLLTEAALTSRKLEYDYHIPAEVLDRFLENMKFIPTMQSIGFVGEALSDERVTRLSSVLENSREAFSKLELKQGLFGLQGLRALLSTLEECSCLKSVHVSSSTVITDVDEGLVEQVIGLSKRPSLQEFYMEIIVDSHGGDKFARKNELLGIQIQNEVLSQDKRRIVITKQGAKRSRSDDREPTSTQPPAQQRRISLPPPAPSPASAVTRTTSAPALLLPTPPQIGAFIKPNATDADISSFCTINVGNESLLYTVELKQGQFDIAGLKVLADFLEKCCSLKNVHISTTNVIAPDESLFSKFFSLLNSDSLKTFYIEIRCSSHSEVGRLQQVWKNSKLPVERAPRFQAVQSKRIGGVIARISYGEAILR